jgi:hypothetical protein
VYTNGKEKVNFNLPKGQSVTFKHRLVIGSTLYNARLEALFNSFKSR